MTRARDLGIRLGHGRPGPFNAITDVAGVRVGHATLISGHGPLVVGKGPIRTGVTAIVPHDGDVWREPVFAGSFSLNGNGEMTGLLWIEESGLLSSIIGLSNTHAIGVVHDALVRTAVATTGEHLPWTLPVASETWDGMLNDIDGMHVRTEHVTVGHLGREQRSGGRGQRGRRDRDGLPRVQGRDRHRVARAPAGQRRLDGRRPGASPTTVTVISCGSTACRSARRSASTSSAARTDSSAARRPGPEAGAGSIIGIVATDAPLLPHQCVALAKRAALGAARVGCYASLGSGDIFLAFATGNRGLASEESPVRPGTTVPSEMVAGAALTPLLLATVEAVEEAIVNCLVAAETMTGRDGITAHALPHDRLVEVMTRHGRNLEPPGGV